MTAGDECKSEIENDTQTKTSPQSFIFERGVNSFSLTIAMFPPLLEHDGTMTKI